MNVHVYKFSRSSHNPLPTAHHLCWLGLPVFVMAVGKQWRGEALFSLSPSMVPVIVETTHQLLQKFVLDEAKSMRSHRNPQPL